jgi:hypothetical protein
MSNTRLARAALWYARYGWAVFPLRPHTKEPFAQLGVYNATTDPARVAEWWQRWPHANIGLHCGGAGLLALDIDAYKDSYAGMDILACEMRDGYEPDRRRNAPVTRRRMEQGTATAKGDLPPVLTFGDGAVHRPAAVDSFPAERRTSGRWLWPHEIDPLLLPDGLRRC